MKQIVDNKRAVAITTLNDWGVVYIIVNGSGQVRVGDNPTSLQNDTQDGIPYNATTPATTPLWWKGILFAIADVQTQLSVITPSYGTPGPLRQVSQ